MDPNPQFTKNQTENKKPVSAPPVSPVIPSAPIAPVAPPVPIAPPVPSVSPVEPSIQNVARAVAPSVKMPPPPNNPEKPAIDINAQHTGQQFKLATSEVQGPKPPLVVGGGSKFALIAITAILIIVFGIGGYYFYTKDGVSNPAVSPAASPVKAIPVEDKSLDSDKDGLPDSVEKVLGTYMTKADTDGDGYSDLNEIKSGYSPLIVGGVGKYSLQEWDLVKGKIKIEDRELYEREFETPVESSNFKIYKNEEYGFEVKYPGNWEKVDKTPAIMSFAKSSDIKTKKSDELFMIQIRATDRKSEISFVDQIKGKSGVNPELIKINGKDFYYAKNQLMGITSYEYDFELNNKFFQILAIIFSKLPDNIVEEKDIIYATDEELKEELNVLNDMVSSFIIND